MMRAAAMLLGFVASAEAYTMGAMPATGRRVSVQMGGMDTSKTYDYRTGTTPGYSGEKLPFSPSSRKMSLKGATGVKYEIIGDITSAITEAVAFYGKKAIASKGSFTLCIPGGSVVKAASTMKKDAMDWSKVHVFFANEKLNDMACYNGAQEFIKNVGIPEANVHKTMDGSYEKVAEDYAAKISELVPKNKHGVPSFDLVLLGTGDDGHVGSLYPNTPELINGYGTGKLVMPINSGGKGTVAISMDLMNAADAVVLSAVGAIRKDMVKATKEGHSSMPTGRTGGWMFGKFAQYLWPAGLVKTADPRNTIWLVDGPASPL
jgi:6-phosphogluconolactonase